MRNDQHILLAPYDAVYIDIAKVASSSLKAMFADLLGLELKEANGNPHQADFPYPAGLDIAGERLYRKYTSFAFVRNPFDRLVSCYRDKIMGEGRDFTEFSERGIAHCLSAYREFHAGMSFDDFVRAVASISDERADEHFRSQHTFVTNTGGTVAADFIGRFETLDLDFQQLAMRIGLPSNLRLPQLQTAQVKVEFRSYYTPETARMVTDRYARDFELFSYASVPKS